MEDKVIKSENANDNPERIEIAEEDLTEDNGILVDRKEIIQKFNRVLKQDMTKVIISMILIMVSILCFVYVPQVAGKTVDLMIYNFNSANDPAIYTNFALLLALYSVGYLFMLPSKRIMGIIGEKIAYNLRIEMFDKLDIIGSGFIQENSKGHYLSRLNNDLMNVMEFVFYRISEIYAQLLSIALVIVFILMTDFKLSLIYLAALPIYVICFYMCDAKSRVHYDCHQKHLGRMMSYFERILSNRSSFHEKGFEKFNQTVIGYYIKSRNISNIIVPITTFLINMSHITV